MDKDKYQRLIDRGIYPYPYYDESLREKDRELEKKVVRIETAESKFNVEIKNIGIVCERYRREEIITIYWGIFVKDGTALNRDISVCCVLYGKNDRIKNMQVISTSNLRDNFFNISCFSFSSPKLFERSINKILIFPSE